MKALLFALIAATAAILPAHAQAATQGKVIPAAPYYYVLDEPGVLGAQATRAIETLLIEHDHLTGEQVVVAIFKSLDGEDAVDFSNRVFSQWKIGQRGKDNGVLLALYWADHQARIEVGYGLESTLTDAKSKLILSDILLPALKNSQPDQAVSLATLEILKTIGSPLVQNGKAVQILRSGGFQCDLRMTAPSNNGGGNTGAWPWLGFGFILLMIVINFFQSAEAHFSRAGLYSPSASEYYRIRGKAGNGGWLGGRFGGAGLGGGLGPGGLGGGGFGGGGGGFGGFLGGGGSSGGGGASGSW